MAPSTIRRALGAVKDQTSIGIAKVSSSTSLSDLDVAIVKATRHEEYPAEERHIREILSLTCYSRAHISACVNTLSRRLSKTRNWIVALKTLMLIQRLLAEGDPAYEQEIFFSTRRGTRLLNMSDFCDNSKANSWDFSAFVRTYALYLDERLEFRMQSRRGKRSLYGFDEEEEEERQVASKATPMREMKTDTLFSRVQHLQQLLERFLACRPTGEAKTHRIVIVALYPTVKESIQIYYDLTEAMSVLLDRFQEMDVLDCVKVYETFCRVGKQFDELDMFYGWCRSIGVGRSSEYPEVERITPKKLDIMDEFIKEKSAEAQSKRGKSPEEKVEAVADVKEPEPDPDINSIKALPPPEGLDETPPEEEEKEEPKEEEPMLAIVKQEEGDLLHLGDDEPTSEEHADKLALALFDGSGPATGPPPPPVWEAFGDDKADWETALVQSASHLSHQKALLGGGFDMLLLDGMYKQAETKAAMAGPGFGVSGSASSVALGSAGRPAMLALPAPLTANGASGSVDPFAASMAVAPPPYVQMSDMEKKQKLLAEEQLMWQQYARDGMQGQHTLARLQYNPMEGYQPSYGH